MMFQSLLMNRHTKYEDVMQKIDTVGEGIEFSCLTCGGDTQIKKNVTIFMWGFVHDKNR
jgi:hypothetical protein